MNERIKELERQATETVKCGLNGTSTTESFNRKKFAELIVRECGVALSPMLRDMVSRGQAYDLIKQHFEKEKNTKGQK